MTRPIKTRLLVVLAVTVVATACGMMAGYWFGRQVTLRLTTKELQHDAARAISETEMYARDDHGVLDAMSASSYPHCSEEDMGFLHHLLFHSVFVKEIGRIRDNRIACSTTIGRDHPSTIELPKPEAIGTDGVKVYRDPLFFGLPSAAIITLQMGDSYVILYPYFENLRERSAIRMKPTVVDASHSQSAHLAETDSKVTQPILTRNSDFRIGEVMYSTRCSSLSIDHICITASISTSEALQAGHRDLKIFIVLGGLIGAFFGFFYSILYRRHHNMEHQLRKALRKDRLHLAYQPIVDLASKRIVGAEGLARWTDERGLAIGPDVFVNIAEKNGFVGEITRLVVRHALRDFAETLRANPEFRLSINVAAADLSDPKFLPMLDRSLDQASVSAQSLAIEITESSTALYKVAVETIHQLRRRGHSIHIDDFGTGYSSLSYLHDLSVDAIKIDRSFTQAIGTEAVTVAILPQILAMAKALNLEVIVEGVETVQQAAYFPTNGQPIMAQGWLFGRPVPVKEFLGLLIEDEEKTLDSAAVS